MLHCNQFLCREDGVQTLSYTNTIILLMVSIRITFLLIILICHHPTFRYRHLQTGENFDYADVVDI